VAPGAAGRGAGTAGAGPGDTHRGGRGAGPCSRSGGRPRGRRGRRAGARGRCRGGCRWRRRGRTSRPGAPRGGGGPGGGGGGARGRGGGGAGGRPGGGGGGGGGGGPGGGGARGAGARRGARAGAGRGAGRGGGGGGARAGAAAGRRGSAGAERIGACAARPRDARVRYGRGGRRGAARARQGSLPGVSRREETRTRSGSASPGRERPLSRPLGASSVSTRPSRVRDVAGPTREMLRRDSPARRRRARVSYHETPREAPGDLGMARTERPSREGSTLLRATGTRSDDERGGARGTWKRAEPARPRGTRLVRQAGTVPASPDPRFLHPGASDEGPATRRRPSPLCRRRDGGGGRGAATTPRLAAPPPRPLPRGGQGAPTTSPGPERPQARALSPVDRRPRRRGR